MDQINISHINMTGIQTPLFIKLGDRNRRNPDTMHLPSVIRNITISDVNAVSVSKMSSSITGFPGSYVQNVRLSNISFISPGGGNAGDTVRAVPENKGQYPENRMFGYSLPAYGLYIRHATQITLQNVVLGFSAADVRPAIVVDDVNGITGKGLTLQPPSSGGSAVKVTGSTNVSL
jgi:hypothetical protein